MTARRFLPPPELWLLLLAAFGLRLAAYFVFPSIHWADEIFQVTEPAHRLAFGTGIVAWEWQVGIRSWVFPGLVAGLMRLGALFGDTPATINLPLTLFMSAAGCIPAACAYGWGRAFNGRAAGFIAAFVAAFWIDSVLLSAHPLYDTIGADLLPLALYLAFPGGDAAPSRRRLMAAGALFGLTFVLRFQLGPALAVAAVGACGVKSGAAPRWRALLGVAAVPVLLSGALDWVTLGAPFRSIAGNVWYNLVLGVSSGWHLNAPAYVPLVLPFYMWGAAATLLLGAAAFGARRLPYVAAAAVTIFVVHSLIAHKEFRFFYPAVVLATILAGVGTAELLRFLRDGRPHAFATRWLPAVLAAIFWLAAILPLGASSYYRQMETRFRGQVLAFDAAARRADLCGLALYGNAVWPDSPGFSFLPRGTRLGPADRATLARDASLFNYLVTRRRETPADPRYRPAGCFEGDWTDGAYRERYCLWHRDGGCATGPVPAFAVNMPASLGRGDGR